MSLTRVAALTVLGLFLTGCWGADPPDPLPASNREEQSVSDDQLLALKEIADMMREGKAYCGIVADLDLELETPTALRFKSIVERAARDQLEFEKRLAEIDIDEFLSPAILSTFTSREESITSIGELGKLYFDHAFKGSERTLEAVRFFVAMGAELEFDPFKIVQSDIDGLTPLLEAMVHAYGEVVVVCNEGGVKLEGGRLMFRDSAMVQKYEQAVASASTSETAFQASYQAVLTARQTMIDKALRAAYEALQPPEETVTQ